MLFLPASVSIGLAEPNAKCFSFGHRFHAGIELTVRLERVIGSYPVCLCIKAFDGLEHTSTFTRKTKRGVRVCQSETAGTVRKAQVPCRGARLIREKNRVKELKIGLERAVVVMG